MNSHNPKKSLKNQRLIYDFFGDIIDSLTQAIDLLDQN